MPRAIDPSVARAAAVGVALLLGGCLDVTRRADDLWPYAGDAVAANKAIQTIDPWPPASRDTSIRTNGARMAEAIVRYKTNAAAAPVAPPPGPAVEQQR
jgi:hypothetical protein